MSEWYTEADWYVAAATGLLVVATSGLWIYTALLWSETRKAVADSGRAIDHAREAAQAATRQADLAERTAVALERPYVFLEQITLVKTETGLGGSTSWAGTIKPGALISAWVKFRLRNHGRTPAIVEEVSLRLLHEESFPDIPKPITSNNILADVVLGEGDTSNPLESEGVKSKEAEYDVVLGMPTKQFFLHGSVRYVDVVGYIYIKRIALQFMENGRILKVFGEDLNVEGRYEPKRLPDVKL